MRMFLCLVFGSACALPAQIAAHAAPPGGRPSGACDPAHDHCIRPTTWFHMERPAGPGTASPVTPVHEKDGKWVTYASGETVGDGILLRTEVAKAASTKKGELLIVWQPRADEPLYPESEDQAQTSTTRWVSMVVETVSPSAGTFTIQARPDRPFPLAASRRVVESKKVPPEGGR
jgi:hypothetical protein